MRKLLCVIGLVVLAGCGSAGPKPSARVENQPTTQPATPAPTAPVGPLPGQPTFASPEQAVEALDKGANDKDLTQMARIVGLSVEDVRESDSVKDGELAERFANAYNDFHRIVMNPQDPTRAQLFIGKQNYPLASPLIRTGGTWYFDSAGGKAELRARVIGENELNTIGVCRAYVQAQYEYYSEDRNGDDVLQYAQRLGSTKGQRDGLYWHSEGDQPESPLGPLVAQARASGYLRGSARTLDEPKPYHGYLFQVLTQQGPHAPGGAYSYIINGRMIAGFALVAVPAKYGKTGVVTFQVGANGKVYQKDLGGDPPDSVLTSYDPDQTWTLVQD